MERRFESCPAHSKPGSPTLPRLCAKREEARSPGPSRSNLWALPTATAAHRGSTVVTSGLRDKLKSFYEDDQWPHG